MHHHKPYWCLALLLLLAITSHAQQRVTLKDLLNQVDQKAPALIADSASIAIRQAQANETRSNWLPNLKLNYQADIGTNNNTGGGYFGFGVIPSNSRGVRPDANTAAVLTNL